LESLGEIRDLLGQLEASDRLEWLVAQGDKLPDLDPKYADLRDSGAYGISECMAPVFFMVAREDSLVKIVGDVPKEAPTARGFVGLLFDHFDGQSSIELPEDILDYLHLKECLSFQRQRGLGAIYAQLRSKSLDGST